MSSVVRIFRRGYSTVRDGHLIKALRSELKDEQSSDTFKGHKDGSLGKFELSWNEDKSKDVVLRRKIESGEEIAVSALLGDFHYGGENSLPYKALMKVCVKKPELTSLLQFDCVIENNGHGVSEFEIQRAGYLPSMSSLGDSVYKGPFYSELDPQLQATLKEYLKDRGVGEELTNFIILHLHRKEKGQYMNWLSKLETIISKDPTANAE